MRRARAAALVLAAACEDMRASYRWRRAGSGAGQTEVARSALLRMRALVPTQRRTAMWMSRRVRVPVTAARSLRSFA